MARKSARFNRLAEVELHEAVAWYEERVPGLGLRFATVVARCARRMAAFLGLFVQAAETAGRSRLLTEDLNEGQS